MRELIESLGESAPPAILGFSWGAMLAQAFAAEHPELAGPIVLIGCGTFDPLARARLGATIEERMTESLRLRIERVTADCAGGNDAASCALRAKAALMMPLYSYDLVDGSLANVIEPENCDARAHEETWADMMRLQEQGMYPARFSAIRAPLLMLHGAFDPHPGRMILASLQPHISRIQYREWEQCGHYPWLEKAARIEFFMVLRRWLLDNL